MELSTPSGDNYRIEPGADIVKASFVPRMDRGSFNRGSIAGAASADALTAQSGDNTQAAKLEQPLAIDDLPTLARHLAPLLQDQQAERPPQYGH